MADTAQMAPHPLDLSDCCSWAASIFFLSLYCVRVWKRLRDVFTLNASLWLKLGPLEPGLTKRVIRSVPTHKNSARYCIQGHHPFPSQDLTEAVLSVRFSCSISCQGLESHQRGIVKRLRSTPRLPTVQRGNTAPPPPGSCNGNGW